LENLIIINLKNNVMKKIIYVVLLIALNWSCNNAPQKEVSASESEIPKKEILELFNIENNLIIDSIMGKKPMEVEALLGNPLSKEKINPRNTPCPCDKMIYDNGNIEIVFINGVADWITINSPRFGKLKYSIDYKSVDRFSDYLYVKAYTN